MMNAETMRQRGVFARFIWIAPLIRWDEILTGRDVPSLDRDAVARYGEMLTRLLDSSEKSEGEPHLLKMSAEAQEGVYRLEQAKVDGMRPGGPLQSVPAFAGKLPDHGSRIAALLALADRAARGKDLFHDPIPAWAMESAERLIAAISTHVVKVTGNAVEEPVLSDLLYLMERVQEMEGGTESEIREKARARGRFRTVGNAKKMFDELERCGFIRRISQERVSGPGRNPSPRIEMNPTLRGSDFSDKRQFTDFAANKSEKSEGGAGTLVDKMDAQPENESEGGVEGPSAEDRRFLEAERDESQPSGRVEDSRSRDGDTVLQDLFSDLPTKEIATTESGKI